MLNGTLRKTSRAQGTSRDLRYVIYNLQVIRIRRQSDIISVALAKCKKLPRDPTIEATDFKLTVAHGTEIIYSSSRQHNLNKITYC